MNKCPPVPIIIMLVVCILVNGLGLSFKGGVFAHELDHARQAIPADPIAHLAFHRDSLAKDGIDLDAATHLCLHSAGQYQPFFFHSLPQVFEQTITEAVIMHISTLIPETIPDLPLRPPSILAIG